MIDVGLESSLAPVLMLTFAEPEQTLLSDESWKDIEFEVALDSGIVVHFCFMDDVPGYQLGESPGSRRGQDFLMGDGGPIPNLGQSQLNLSDTTVGRNIESVVHVCSMDDVPGYRPGESPGSRRGQEFLMGDGGLIPNLGQSQLN